MFPVATKFVDMVICFTFTDACVTNSTVSVLMNAMLSGRGVLVSSLILTLEERTSKYGQ